MAVSDGTQALICKDLASGSPLLKPGAFKHRAFYFPHTHAR
jgi:hypothetical protein